MVLLDGPAGLGGRVLDLRAALGRLVALVVRSSLWPKRPDALLRFDLTRDGGRGTSLCWTLLVDEPMPDPALLGHLRKRVNQLINGQLRYSFGQ